MADARKGIRQLDGSAALRVVQYRNRAEELRVIADELVLNSERETLLRIADTYDDMADHASPRAAGITSGANGPKVN